MTKEQEKAIYRLNLGKNIPISSECCIVNVKDIETVLSMLEEKDKIISSKDKIIDLMANHIATSDSDLCEYLDITTKCKYYAGENGKTCDNCIKQYFENKVRG